MPLLETGKPYKLPNGKVSKLYPIGKLASELRKIGYTRDAQTIRKWETSGVTPPTPFRKGNKRLYTMEHIKLFCRLAQECDIRQGLPIASTDFSERIWEESTKLFADQGFTN